MIRALLLALLALSIAAPVEAQTLDQMAGQMIIVGFDGDTAADPSVKAIAKEVGAGMLGGIMYLKPNVKSLADVTAMNAEFRAANPSLPPVHRARPGGRGCAAANFSCRLRRNTERADHSCGRHAGAGAGGLSQRWPRVWQRLALP